MHYDFFFPENTYYVSEVRYYGTSVYFVKYFSKKYFAFLNKLIPFPSSWNT